jgi:hypothetical protein
MRKNIIILLLLALTSASLAQEPARIITVAEVIQAYQNANFNRTVELADEAIRDYQRYLRSELIQIYTYRAYAQFSLANDEGAAASFRSALSLNKELQLDEVTVSPKIISFFNKLKLEYLQSEPAAKPVEEGETKYILIEDPSRKATLRSIVLPGWGQWYKKDYEKAYYIGGAFVVNSLALIYVMLDEEKAHDTYLSAKFPSDIQAKYADYNQLFRQRQILTYTELLIYGIAFFDALWAPLPQNNPISISASDGRIGLQIQF